MKTPYDWLAKMYTNCSGHMTKMATMPIDTKNPLNIFFSGTKNQKANGLNNNNNNNSLYFQRVTHLAKKKANLP